MYIGYIGEKEGKAERDRRNEEIRSFAREKGIRVEGIYAEQAIGDIKEVVLPRCQGVIISNMRILGENLRQIKENLLYCREHKLQIYSIEDGYEFNEQNLSDDFFKGIDIAIEVRRDLISQTVKKVLKERKKEGKKLGRPFGAKVKSKLEKNTTEILQMINSGISKSEIARRLGVTRVTVLNFIKRNGLEARKRHQGERV